MISPYLLAFPWQHWMHYKNCKHVFKHNGVLSLYCESNSKAIKDFKIFQILGPNMAIIDPGPLLNSKFYFLMFDWEK